MKKISLLFVAGFLLLLSLVLIRFSHIRSVSVPEMVDMTNRFFAAVATNDQGQLDQIVVTPQEVAARHPSELPPQSSVRVDVTIDPNQQGDPELVDLNDLHHARKAYAGLTRLTSYSYELDPMGSRLVMNFNCQNAAANACIKHINFSFTSENPLKIDSIQDFRNTAEWDGIWNNQFNRGLTTEAAPPNLFKLPLLEKK